MIKALFFDLDGTLVDTLPLILKSYNSALKKIGFTLSDKDIVKTCFGNTEEVICEGLGVPNKLKEFKETYFENIKKIFNEGKSFPNVADVLDLAKEKEIKLAVISFAYRWYLDKMIGELDLTKYLDLVIGFDDVMKPKPNPEAVITACKQLKVEPKNCVMVGDSKKDIEMGKAAGSQTILFYPENYDLFYNLNELRKSNPDKIISDFSEIKDLLLKI